jgi:putative peptidoglycan lipid II flippase
MKLSQFREWGGTVAGGAVIVATFSVVSRVFGLVRDRLLASHFGAGQITDAYYAAFRLPDFVFQTLVLGALASAFIPIFVQAYHKNREDGWRVANGLTTVLFMTMGILAILMVILAPWLVRVVAPGYVGEQQALTVAMTRVMLVAVVLFAVSNVASGVLQGLRRFVAFSAAPVVYNLGLILGIVALVPLLGPIGLAWGVVVGAFGHLVIQIIAARRAGWKPAWLWAWRDKDVRHVWRLMLPRTLGLAAGQVNQVVITIIASTLAAGSLSQLTWADNLQNVPTNVFGLPLAIASFPVLAQATASNDTTSFIDTVRSNLRRILFLVIPIASLLVVLRAHVVRVVLGAGHFDWSDTYYTAQIVGIFSVALVANSAIALLARAFYARQDTRTPVRWAIGGVIINVAVALLLAPKFGVLGVAMATSMAAAFQAIGLSVTLHLRTHIINRALLRTVGLTIMNAIVASLVARFILEIGQPLLALRTVWGVLGQGLAAGGVGVTVYLGLGLLTDSQDVALLRTYLQRYSQPLRRIIRRP